MELTSGGLRSYLMGFVRAGGGLVLAREICMPGGVPEAVVAS
jgi:hypothetical protein